MLEGVVAFFAAAGLVSLFAAKRLVGVRAPRHELAAVDIATLDVDELRALTAELVAEVLEIRELCAELRHDSQEVREMVLVGRLTSRRAVQRTAKRDAHLQQGIAGLDARLRELESDRAPALVPVRTASGRGGKIAPATA